MAWERVCEGETRIVCVVNAGRKSWQAGCARALAHSLALELLGWRPHGATMLCCRGAIRRRQLRSSRRD